MGKDIYDGGALTVTEMWGGEERGQCYQITIVEGYPRGGIAYTQLTKDAFKNFIEKMAIEMKEK